MNLLQQAELVRQQLHKKTITSEKAKEKVEQILDEVEELLEHGSRSDALAARNLIKRTLAHSLGLSARVV